MKAFLLSKDRMHNDIPAKNEVTGMEKLELIEPNLEYAEDIWAFRQ